MRLFLHGWCCSSVQSLDRREGRRWLGSLEYWLCSQFPGLHTLLWFEYELFPQTHILGAGNLSVWVLVCKHTYFIIAMWKVTNTGIDLLQKILHRCIQELHLIREVDNSRLYQPDTYNQTPSIADVFECLLVGRRHNVCYCHSEVWPA